MYNFLSVFFQWFFNPAKGLGILFEGINIESIYDGSCSVDLLKVLDILKLNGNNNELEDFPSVSTINDFKCKHQISDLRQLSRGHDVVGALRCRIRAIKKGKNVKDSVISKMLRVGFSKQDFMATKLYQDIKQWSESRGYHIWAI